MIENYSRYLGFPSTRQGDWFYLETTEARDTWNRFKLDNVLSSSTFAALSRNTNNPD